MYTSCKRFLTKMILEVGDYDYLPQSWFLNYHGKCKFFLATLLFFSVLLCYGFIKIVSRKCIER